MINNKIGLKGFVRVEVLDKDGKTKRHNPNWIKRLFGIPGKNMISENHNIVTNEGDALIADLMANTPARTKVDNSNGYIELGTGFVSEAKTALSCTTPTGSTEAMDSGYPQLKGTWGNANDNVTVYKSTFEAGDLNATGIDEVALLNNATAASADCLAYAEITPVINVTTADTVVVTWELTFTGA